MKTRSVFSTAIAIGAGFIVLLMFFFPFPKVMDEPRNLLVGWAIGIAAFAVLVGVANLMGVHWRKIRSGQKAGYSLVVIISFAITLLIVARDLVTRDHLTGSWSLWLFDNVQIPVEASLMAVAAVAMIYTAARMLRRRMTTMSWIFLATLLLMLLGSAPLYLVGNLPAFSGVQAALLRLHPIISHTLATAGARGILLGVALGVIATGARILLGADRPYSG